MQHDDRTRLVHMIEAAEAAVLFVTGRTRRDLDTDAMPLFALVRAVEVFGEAAGKVFYIHQGDDPHYSVAADRRNAKPACPCLFRR